MRELSQARGAECISNLPKSGRVKSAAEFFNF